MRALRPSTSPHCSGWNAASEKSLLDDSRAGSGANSKRLIASAPHSVPRPLQAEGLRGSRLEERSPSPSGSIPRMTFRSYERMATDAKR